MEIRLVLSFCLSFFIIINVSELNATTLQQKNVNRVCGESSRSYLSIFDHRPLQRRESPWLVALFNKLKSPPEFFCAGTLISTRHVQQSVSFGKRNQNDRLKFFSIF